MGGDEVGDDAEGRQRDDVDFGMTEEPEQMLKQDRAAAIVAELFNLWEMELPRISGKSKLAEAIRYATSRRKVLECFLIDGRFAALGLKTDSILDALAARILRVPGVARVIRPADLARADTASDPVARRWLHHLTPDAGVVLTVTLQTGSVWDIPSFPYAMHGQPSDDDAHVPIIFWGHGIKRGSYAGRMNTVDIAPTLGALLGVSPLSLVDGHARTDALGPGN